MDARKYGLEATLIQSSCPIAFASKTLTDIETHYMNIEQESLSMLQSGKVPHHIYGSHVTVENDHMLLQNDPA